MKLEPGQRVQLHPATDWWMRGERYGTVWNPPGKRSHEWRALGRTLGYYVKLDKTGRVIQMAMRDIGEVM